MERLSKKNVVLLFLVLVYFILALQSCRLFKQVKTEKFENEAQSKLDVKEMLSLNHELLTDQHFFEWKMDTSSTSASVRIWPKGVFKFTVAHGFEGEAERVIINSREEKSARGIKTKDSLSKKRDQLDLKQSRKELLRKKDTKTVKTETPAFWLIIGLVLLAIAGVIIYKILKP